MNQLKPYKLRFLCYWIQIVIANNTILSCFLFFFLIIDLHFLIPAVVTQISNPLVEFVIPIRIPTKQAKVGLETHPVIVEIAISECSIQFKALQAFLCLLLINFSFWLISSIK